MSKTRKQLLREARKFLKKGYIKGKWVYVKGIGYWDPSDGMPKLREMLAKRPNPDCNVCAQGAVYLACALDGDTNSKRAASIIRSLDRNAGPGRSVMGVNDNSYSVDGVLAVFDKTETRMRDD